MRPKVVLEKYNPKWPDMFEAEKEFLLSVIPEYFEGAIEHIGSTAIPGLMAKPIIDIMFGVKALDDSRGAIEVLEKNGYCYFPYKGDVMHWFCKPSDAFRTHHIHLVPYQSELWKERIKFRRILLENDAVAKEYEQLKIKLAHELGGDREKYTVEKWPFIQRTLETYP